jgi:hypothetical protein
VINSSKTEWLEDAKRGMEASLTAGQAVLASGGSALDAVVAAVMCMEDDPHFNAGAASADKSLNLTPANRNALTKGGLTDETYSTNVAIVLCLGTPDPSFR